MSKAVKTEKDKRKTAQRHRHFREIRKSIARGNASEVLRLLLSSEYCLAGEWEDPKSTLSQKIDEVPGLRAGIGRELHDGNWDVDLLAVGRAHKLYKAFPKPDADKDSGQ